MFSRDKQSIKFFGLKLCYRGQTKPEDHPHYLTTTYNIDGEKNRVAYVIELQKNSDHKHHDFRKFREDKANQNNLLIINFQCKSAAKIYLPEGFACYVVEQKEQKADEKITGQYQIFAEEVPVQSLSVTHQTTEQSGKHSADEAQSILPTPAISKRKHEEVISTNLVTNSGSVTHYATLKPPTKSERKPSQQIVNQTSSQRMENPRSAQPAADSHTSRQMENPRSAQPAADSRTSREVHSDSYHSYDNEQKAKVQKSHQYKSSTFDDYESQSLCEYTLNYCFNHDINLLRDEDIDEYLLHGTSFLVYDRHDLGVVKNFLVELERSPPRMNATEKAQLYKFIIKLIDFISQYPDKKDRLTNRNLSVIIHRLGKLCFQNNLIIPKDIKSHLVLNDIIGMLCESAQTQNSQNAIITYPLKSQDIADTFYGLGRLAAAGIRFENDLIPYCDILLKAILNMEIPPLRITNCLYGIGRLTECGLLFNDSIVTSCIMLFEQLPAMDPSPIDISNALYGLARMASASIILNDRVVKPLEALLAQLLDKPDVRTYSITVWAIGQMLKSGININEKIKSHCEVIFTRFCTMNPDNQGICNMVWGMGQIFKSQSNINPLIFKHCEKLLRSIAKSNPKAISVASIFNGLGHLASTGAEFSYDVIVDAELLLKEQSYKNADQFNISLTLWGFSRLINDQTKLNPNTALYFEHLVKQFCDLNVAALKEEPHKVQSKEVSNVLWAIGRLASRGICFNTTIVKHCEVLLSLINQIQPNNQSISNSLWGIGCLAQANTPVTGSTETLMPMTQTIGDMCVKLFNKLGATQPTNQHISNSIWALARLVDRGIILDSTIGSYSEKSLIPQFQLESATDQEISNNLWGMGRLVAANILFSQTIANNCEAMLKAICHMPTASSVSISNCLFGMAQLAAHGALFNENNVEYCGILLDKLSKLRITEPAHIVKTIWALGRLSEVDIRLSDDLAMYCEKLLNQLCHMQLNSKETANILLGLGHMSMTGITFNHWVMRYAIELMNKLKDLNPNNQGIANSVWGLGALATKNMHIQTSVAISWQEVFKQFYAANPIDLQIGMFLWGVGRLAQKNVHFDPLVSKEIGQLLEMLYHKKHDAQSISNSLWGLSFLSKAGIQLSAKSAKYCQLLLEDLATMPGNGKSIANSLHGLGILAAYNNKSAFRIEQKCTAQIHVLLNKLTEMTPIANIIFYDILDGLVYLIETWHQQGALDVSNHQFNDSLLHFITLSIDSLNATRLTNIQTTKLLFNISFIIQSYSLKLKDSNPLIQYIQTLLKRNLPSKQLMRLEICVNNLAQCIDEPIIAEFKKTIQHNLKVHHSYVTPNNDSDILFISNAKAIAPSKPMMTACHLPLPAIHAPKRQHHIFNVRKKDEIDTLEAHIQESQGCHFTYDREANKNRGKEISLYVAEVALLGGQFGLYAVNNVSINNTILGVYAGERLEQVDLEQTQLDISQSAYYFQLGQLTQGKGTVIDAKHLGDYTRAANTNQSPNVYTREETYRGSTNIYFRLRKPVKSMQQLFIDYGDHYLSNVDFTAFYMHPSDNWETKEERFSKLKNYYYPHIVSFDDATCRALHLTGNQFVVPKIFQDIMNNDVTSLQNDLAKNNYSIEEMVAYACTADALLPYESQQHLTPLMLACYLGRESCIRTLIKSGSDLQRCMLVSGDNALSLLIQGHASTDLVEKLCEEWLNIPDPINVSDLYSRNQHDLTILHYALQRRSARLIDIILSKADIDKILNVMYDRHENKPAHAHIDGIILNRQFDILDVVFKHLSDSLLQEYIESGYIFSENTLIQLTNAEISQLKEIINKYKDKFVAINLPQRLAQTTGITTSIAIDLDAQSMISDITPAEPAKSTVELRTNNASGITLGINLNEDEFIDIDGLSEGEPAIHQEDVTDASSTHETDEKSVAPVDDEIIDLDGLSEGEPSSHEEDKSESSSTHEEVDETAVDMAEETMMDIDNTLEEEHSNDVVEESEAATIQAVDDKPTAEMDEEFIDIEHISDEEQLSHDEAKAEPEISFIPDADDQSVTFMRSHMIDLDVDTTNNHSSSDKDEFEETSRRDASTQGTAFMQSHIIDLDVERTTRTLIQGITIDANVKTSASQGNKMEVVENNNNASEPSQAPLISLRGAQPQIVAQQSQAKIFDLAVNDHHRKLEQYIQNSGMPKFKFNGKDNQADLNNFIVAEIAAISRPDFIVLGLFTKHGFGCDQVGKKVCVYVGDKKQSGSNINEAYAIDTADGVIDASLNGGIARFLQGSQTSNIYIEEIKGEVHEKLVRTIPRKGQLLGNYGYNYTIPGVKTRFYLHTSDHWETNEERYLRLKRDYCTTVFDLDEKSKTSLQLVGHQFLIPELFLHIANNDIEKFNNCLASLRNRGINLEDLVLLAMDDYGIRPYAEQQHVSAIMYACYIGHKACIEALIAAGADMDRAELVAGNNALSLLLQGQAPNEVVCQLAPKMLDATQPNIMCNPFTVNTDELGILHYALQRHLVDVSKSIISLASGPEIMQTMYDRDSDQLHHYNIDDCILDKRWDLLMLLIKTVGMALIDKEVLAGNILSDVTAHQLFSSSRKKLYETLTENPIIYDIVKESKFFERVSTMCVDSHIEIHTPSQTQTLFTQQKEKGQLQSSESKMETNYKRKQ